MDGLQQYFTLEGGDCASILDSFVPFAQACFINRQRCPEAIALHGLNHRDLMAGMENVPVVQFGMFILGSVVIHFQET